MDAPWPLNAPLRSEMDQLVFTICRLAEEKQSPRLMVALAGGPAAGKSTLGAALVEAVNAASTPHRAIYVPMDGFHKAAAVLQAEGTTALKGKPQTFDAEALCSFLQRLKRGDRDVSGPAYSRVCHDVVSDAYRVGTEDIAIVEGNYLLLDEPPWRKVQDLFDYKIFLRVSEETSAARLYRRHLAGGRSEEWTKRHMNEVDLPNHRLIASSEKYADVIVPGE